MRKIQQLHSICKNKQMGVACVFGIAIVVGGVCAKSILTIAVGAILIFGGLIYLVVSQNNVKSQVVRYEPGSNYIQKGYINGFQAHGHINAQELSKRIWTKIQLDEKDRFFLKVLTSKEFQQKAKKYSCKIDGLIIKDPIFLKCCNNMVELTSWQKKRKKQTSLCPVCGKQKINIVTDILKTGDVVQVFKDGITSFRKQIVLTHQKLSSELRGILEDKIDKLFGINYSKEHLQT